MHAAVLLALALSVPTSPIVPVQASTAFDGTWSGTGTLTRSRGASCTAAETSLRFVIQNGQFNFTYDNRNGTSFSGPIRTDGSFDLASGRRRFQGQANGSNMTATFSSGENCIRTFIMQRRN